MANQSPTPRIVTKKHIARLERERQQVRLIRAIAIAGIVVVALLLGYGYLKLNVLSAREPVAEVNGVDITTKEWQERVRLERVNLYNQLSRYQFFQQSFGMDTTQQQQEIMMQLSLTESIGQRVLDQMVDEILIRQEAEKRGITVSDEEVESFLQEAYGFFPDGTPSPTLTPTEFALPTLNAEQALLYPPTSIPTEVLTSTPESTSTPDQSATATATATAAPPTPTLVPEAATASPTPYTLEGYQTRFNETITEFKSYGISEDTLRDVYEMELLRKKLLDDMAKELTRTETQVLLRHILVPNEVAAQTIVDRLNRGEDFAKLAAQFSTDPGSAQSGGVYEWAPAANYVPEFRDAALTQEIGVVGPPVKTDYGYHIIQVIGREELPITDSQFEQKKDTALNDWLTTARESADIQTFDIWKERVPTEPVLQ